MIYLLMPGAHATPYYARTGDRIVRLLPVSNENAPQRFFYTLSYRGTTRKVRWLNFVSSELWPELRFALVREMFTI